MEFSDHKTLYENVCQLWAQKFQISKVPFGAYFVKYSWQYFVHKEAIRAIFAIGIQVDPGSRYRKGRF